MITKMNKLSSFLSALLAALLAAALSVFYKVMFGPDIVRARTADVAFGYRMGAGFPGDVNRTHPASVVPALTNATTPPRAYGDPLLHDLATNSLRGVVSGDQSATAINIAGIMVRSFPTQQMSGGMSSALGAAVPPTSGVLDVCSQGFVICKIPAGAVAAKGGQVFIWCAATASTNVQGALVVAASAGNTVPVANAKFNGPADADGNVEVEVWAGR